MTVTSENVAGVVSDFNNGLLDELAGRDREFCNDLINGKYGYYSRGYLTENQLIALGRLHQKALGVKPEVQSDCVGDLTGLVELFKSAKKKWPRIRVEINGHPLQFALAGPKSKYAGSVTITDGGPYGDNKWYGAVTPEGVWTPSSQVTPELRTVIARTLTSFSHNPTQAAMKYGHQTIQCCFCSKALDTKESQHVGYGPVCADNWGLPWGHTD